MPTVTVFVIPGAPGDAARSLASVRAQTFDDWQAVLIDSEVFSDEVGGRVRVESGGQTFYDLTDLIHFPGEVTHLDWAPWGCDAATSARTRRRLFGEVAAADALLTFAHARFPGWGRLGGAPERPVWRWETGA